MAADETSQSKRVEVKEWLQFIQEFKSESDRAAVILGAAKLDLLLYQVLQKRFLPSTTGVDELLDGEAPLGTFSAKINLAYRLGIIDAAFARALHLVRKIRNGFAHEVSGCTLDSGSHRERVRELIAPLRGLPGVESFERTNFGACPGPSTDFRVALGLMAVLLEIARDLGKSLAGTDTIKLVPDFLRKPPEAK